MSVDDALNCCLQNVELGSFRLVRLEQAIGHTAAEDLYVTEDLPPFRKSLMDGFAVRAEDVEAATEQCPVELQVIDELPAGAWSDAELSAFTAVRTMTGAQVLPGADAVVRLERVRTGRGGGKKGQSIFLSAPIQRGESIQQQGTDLPAGSLLYPAGTKIGSREAAVLAAAGIHTVPVVTKPVIAIVTTGNEVVSHPNPLKHGQIRDTNGPLLNTLLQEQGFRTVGKGTCEDEVNAVRRKVMEVRPTVDVLITTGGVSVGDYDVVPEVMREMGMRTIVRQVSMRPGKPFTIGKQQGLLWFALPGNPAAALLTAHLFVLPTLRKMAGERAVTRRTTAILTGRPTKKVLDVASYWFAQAYLEHSELRVAANQEQSSCCVNTLREVNAFVEVPPGSDPLLGDTVRIVLMGEVGIL